MDDPETQDTPPIVPLDWADRGWADDGKWRHLTAWGIVLLLIVEVAAGYWLLAR